MLQYNNKTQKQITEKRGLFKKWIYNEKHENVTKTFHKYKICEIWLHVLKK